mmetsp:Transcript_3165/g.7439  ORF Transcript_3165/g.7439 Transcript_3165/m.7439 type:complete len:228 (-) Transcript_3165:1901-2584(-)
MRSLVDSSALGSAGCLPFFLPALSPFSDCLSSNRMVAWSLAVRRFLNDFTTKQASSSSFAFSCATRSASIPAFATALSMNHKMLLSAITVIRMPVLCSSSSRPVNPKKVSGSDSRYTLASRVHQRCTATAGSSGKSLSSSVGICSLIVSTPGLLSAPFRGSMSGSGCAPIAFAKSSVRSHRPSLRCSQTRRQIHPRGYQSFTWRLEWSIVFHRITRALKPNAWHPRK